MGASPRVERVLPPAPDSVTTARAVVRSALRGWDLEQLTDTAALLVSELATNAVLHARSDFAVCVERRAGRVRVSVSDCSARTASRRRYGLHAGTGRGLGLIDSLALAWGSDEAAEPWTKTVWFELDEAGVEDAAEGALYGEDWLALVDDL